MHLVVARHTYYPYLLMKIIKMGLYNNPICYLLVYKDILVSIVSLVLKRTIDRILFVAKRIP